ncbi:MAG: PspC domain-containing protein [Patescibacteria group bacterium]
MKKIKRSKDDKVLAGVFGGMGDYFQVDPVMFRLLAVILFFLTGIIPFIIAYIIAIFIIPKEKTGLEEETEQPNRQKKWLWIIIIMLTLLLLSPVVVLLAFRSYIHNTDFDNMNPFFKDESSQHTYHEKTKVVEKRLPGPEKALINDHLEESVIQKNHNGTVFAEHHEFGRSANQIFIWGYIAEYYKDNGELKMGTATSLPLAITFSKNETIKNQVPRDGSHYEEDIRDIFPTRYVNDILNFQSLHKETLTELNRIVENKARSNLTENDE